MMRVTLRSDGEIILVDDDDIEIMIARKNLARSRLRNPLVTFQSGPAFLAHMDRVKEHLHPMPSLVLLDLRMPVMDGFEVLEQLRIDEASSEVPLIMVFSNSDNESDMEKAVQLGAAGYWVKPNSGDEYVALFDQLAESPLPA